MKWIKENRNCLNMSQEQLAEKLGYSRTLINKWEKGTRIPSKAQIEELEYALNCKFTSENISDVIKGRYAKEYRIARINFTRTILLLIFNLIAMSSTLFLFIRNEGNDVYFGIGVLVINQIGFGASIKAVIDMRNVKNDSKLFALWILRQKVSHIKYNELKSKSNYEIYKALAETK